MAWCAILGVLLLAFSTVAAAEPEPSLGPFELRSPSGQHAIQVGLASQLRLTYSDSQPTADAARQQDLAIEVRRLRPMLRGSFLSNRVEMFLHLNTTPGSMELLDLFSQFNFHPQLSLRVGQFKIPYTRYRMQYFTQLPFTDWSILSRYLGAERQLGAALHNGYERGAGFEYALGVFSGINARRAHGVGLGLLYGEKLPDPSDLTALTPPTTFHPELALRVGYSKRGLRPEAPSDVERGPARFGVSLSATYDIRPSRSLDFALRLAPEAQLKVRGLSLHAAYYLTFFQGDGGASDLRPAFYGVLAHVGYRLHQQWEIALRYGLVLSSDALRSDAQTRARALIAAATPAEIAVLRKQYGAAGTLDRDQELLLAVDYYLVGNGLKLQAEAGWLFQVTDGGALDGARLRIQAQVAF
jgi:hypothetical protein